MKKFKITFGLILHLLFQTAWGQTKSCMQPVAEFKKAYFELQKSLNYGNSDDDATYNTKTNKLEYSKHNENEDFKGKKFEKELYTQYKNSLNKVAQLYQLSLKGDSQAILNAKTPALAKFFKSVSEGKNKKFKTDEIDDLLLQLKISSALKFKSPENKDSVLTDNDLYLLKNLLLHASDVICMTHKQDPKIKKEPINKMIELLHKQNIQSNSKLPAPIQVDTKAVINDAILGHLNDLRRFVKNNKLCFISQSFLLNDVANQSLIKTMTEVQGSIQGCNLGSFLLILSAPNTLDIEAILHFINANSKDTKGGTGLSITNFNSFIEDVTKTIECKKTGTDEGPNKIFVQNINDKPFEKMVCQDKEGYELDCKDQIEIIADIENLNRGSEIRRKKDNSIASMSLNMPDSKGCDKLVFDSPTPVVVPVVAPVVEPVVEPVVLKVEPKVAKPSILDAIKPVPQDLYKPISHDKTKLTIVEEAMPIVYNSYKPITPAIENLTILEEEKTTPPPIKDEIDPSLECLKDNKEWINNKCQDKQLAKVLESAEAACEKKNQEWIDAGKEEIHTDRYSWDEKIKSCKDKQDKKSDDLDNEDESLLDYKAPVIYPDKKMPSRFRPTQIPTRQVYILPGMP